MSLLNQGIDTNANGTQASVVTIVDKDGNQVDETNPLKISGSVATVIVTPDADLTQLITVTTAGTPVQGPNKTNPGGWVIKAKLTNTGTMYLMYHGQTAANKGFGLNSGEWMFIPIVNLSDLDFDATINGEKVIALKQ